MFSWVGRLFGTKKAIEDITDKDNGLLTQMGGWFGDLNFTTEEQARWGIELLNALAPFKVMQRIMVTIIMVEWAIIINVWLIAICFNSIPIINSILALVQTQFVWMPVVGAVTLYLFGGINPLKKKA